MIYTRNYNRKIKYNRDLLKRSKIQLKENSDFKEQEIEADLLLIVKLVSFKTLVVKH